jgi:hypothetical protein
MRAKHDRSLLLGRDGDHLDVPLVRSKSVGDVANDLTGEALGTIRVDDTEGDGGIGGSLNGEVAPIPTMLTTMESVVTLVFGDFVGVAVNGKLAVLDTVGIATWGCQWVS